MIKKCIRDIVPEIGSPFPPSCLCIRVHLVKILYTIGFN